MKKEYGLLLPMSSLNSAYGIGDMGKCAYEFVDYMEENGYTLWQMLPINNVDSTNSPYSSDASLSLEELYLDLEELVSKKLLTQRDLSPLKKLSKTHVEYDKLKEIKPKLIKKAYTKLTVEEKNELEAFAISNPYIYEYGLFKALIEKGNLEPDQVDSLGWSPLLHAAENCHLSTCKVLIEHGSDVNLTSKFGFTATHAAMNKNCEELKNYLISVGGKINTKVITSDELSSLLQ